jgi:hypothetical protein
MFRKLQLSSSNNYYATFCCQPNSQSFVNSFSSHREAITKHILQKRLQLIAVIKYNKIIKRLKE